MSANEESLRRAFPYHVCLYWRRAAPGVQPARFVDPTRTEYRLPAIKQIGAPVEVGIRGSKDCLDRVIAGRQRGCRTA